VVVRASRDERGHEPDDDDDLWNRRLADLRVKDVVLTVLFTALTILFLRWIIP
jgi:hypothetical protein